MFNKKATELPLNTLILIIIGIIILVVIILLFYTQGGSLISSIKNTINSILSLSK